MKLLRPSALSEQNQVCSRAFRYVRNCIGEKSASVVYNVETEMLLGVLSDGREVPITVNSEAISTNSYVVSPLSTYIRYAEFELREFASPVIRFFLRAVIRSLGILFNNVCLDRVVHVNNWLLSTNLHPIDLADCDVSGLTTTLRGSFPEHAIIWRSLNRFSNGELIERLLDSGYFLVASRQVYLFDARTEPPPFLDHHNVTLDFEALQKSHYSIIEGIDLQESDFERLEHLYNLLYLRKYSELNPQFSAKWLRMGVKDGWLLVRALCSPSGSIDGVIGFFRDERILTAPIVGYDTGLAQKVGLYRLLTTLAFDEARRSKVLLNFSSGAAHFKRLRGGVPEIEYSAVYSKNLPFRTRVAWKILALVANRIGAPLMKRFGL